MAGRHRSRARIWILDVNGVLVDSTAVTGAAFSSTAAHFGFLVAESDVRRVSGLWLPQAYRVLAPSSDIQACHRHHVEYVRAHMSEIRAYSGVSTTLEAAREAGIRIGAVTSVGETAEACLVQQNLYQYFDCLVTQEEVRHPKPHPESLLLALDLLSPSGKVDPAAALFVGDTTVDLEAGRAAGVPTIAVTYGASDRRTLVTARPRGFIDRFNEMRRYLPAPRVWADGAVSHALSRQG